MLRRVTMRGVNNTCEIINSISIFKNFDKETMILPEKSISVVGINKENAFPEREIGCE